MAEPLFDPVTKPAHYNTHPSGIECIEVSRHLPGDLAQAWQYLYRARYKGEQQRDLRKAEWFLRDHAEHCRTTAPLPGRVLDLALQIVDHEPDWRLQQAMCKILSADSPEEYATAAQLVQRTADGL